MAWDTRSEMRFLLGLGRWRPERSRPHGWPSRLDLWQTYLKTMQTRDDWGKIDPFRIREWIKERIRKNARAQHQRLKMLLDEKNAQIRVSTGKG